MKLFDFAADEYRPAYQEHGWVHVRSGLTDEFLETARRLVAESMKARRLEGQGITGAKAQFLFDFPEPAHYDELADLVADLCGLDRGRLTLSERHIKTYEPDAEPRPVAHKDRFSSQVSMGLSLEVPSGSHLVLFPHDDVWENPCLDTSLRDTLPHDRLPEVVLQGAEEVEIHDRPGDVVVFRGSAFWHLRRNSARTVNVYLKFNDFGADPLGEDPVTAVLRRETDGLADGDDDDVRGSVPVLARRFEALARQYRREGWPERTVAHVWGNPPLPLSDAEADFVRAVDGDRTVGALLAALPSIDADGVRRLARRGVVDLRPSPG